MQGMKLWQVSVVFNGGRTFEYLSDQENRDMAVAVTIKESAKQLWWDREIKIVDIIVSRLSRSQLDENQTEEGHYEGGGL